MRGCSWASARPREEEEEESLALSPQPFPIPTPGGPALTPPTSCGTPNQKVRVGALALTTTPAPFLLPSTFSQALTQESTQQPSLRH